jgi:signal recognition particle receptor subunit beta
MDSAPSEDGTGPPLAVFKIIVAGGFGAGKTTLVGAISEVRPLCTEELLTSVSTGYDDLAGVEDKRATTVAMDFGRITFGSHLLLYLFGTPGQDRFWFMWDELSYGALGAVVLADTRRLADCFPSVDYFEKRQVPFVVAINCFDGAPAHDPQDVRIALDLDPGVPAIRCDARQPASVKRVLIALVEHILASGLASGSPPRTDRTSRLAGERRAIPAGACQGQQDEGGWCTDDRGWPGRVGGAGGIAGKAGGVAGPVGCGAPTRRRLPIQAGDGGRPRGRPGPRCHRRPGAGPGTSGGIRGMARLQWQDPDRGRPGGVTVAGQQAGPADLGRRHQPGVGAVQLRGRGRRRKQHRPRG